MVLLAPRALSSPRPPPLCCTKRMGKSQISRHHYYIRSSSENLLTGLPTLAQLIKTKSAAWLITSLRLIFALIQILPNLFPRCAFLHIRLTWRPGFQRFRRVKSNASVLKSSDLKGFQLGRCSRKQLGCVETVEMQRRPGYSKDWAQPGYRFFSCPLKSNHWKPGGQRSPPHSKRQILTIDVTITLNIPLTFVLNCGRCFLTSRSTSTFVAFLLMKWQNAFWRHSALNAGYCQCCSSLTRQLGGVFDIKIRAKNNTEDCFG